METVMHTLKRIFVTLVVALSLGAMAACAPTPERRAAGEVIDDVALNARVKAAMVKAESVPAASIDVDTFRGEVTLRGTVESTQVMREAVAAARNVQGVRVVRNELKIAPRR
jgi:hyperosmotically inducible periplasmic protein